MSEKEKPRLAGQGENGVSGNQSHSQSFICRREGSRTRPILIGATQGFLFAALPVHRKPVSDWDARLWIYSYADWIARRRQIRHLIVLDHLWSIPASVADLARRWGWREDCVQAFLRSEFSPFVTRQMSTSAEQGRTAHA
ncbi:hypothetical protein [Acidisphaera sp. S103]|uniref:hypothetical protein n=1 Tax=Acidisphaera sp. S103 TaxID=1747223 RepID=UPI00131B0262|nr:hypothetical protein [Acidisphaera sp. S103]